LAFEWNKKNWELKPNNIHSFTTKMDFNNSISSFIHGLNTKNVHRDIPIVERLPSKKIKRTATERKFKNLKNFNYCWIKLY